MNRLTRGFVDHFFEIFQMESRGIFEEEIGIGEYSEINHRKPKVMQVALSILGVISIVFMNIATFGLFTVFGALLQQNKIKQLKDHPHFKTLSPNQFYQWIPPLYAKDRDLSITLVPANESMDRYYEMPHFISAALELAFEEIIRLHKNAKLNKSKKILAISGKNKYIYHQNMKAVYCWMVYSIIKHANLEYACDQKTLLVKLNNALQVGSSNVCQILDQHKVKIFYSYQDEWTPTSTKRYPFGIDPVSLKFILESLKDDKKSIKKLETLLLQALISDSDADLQSAKKYLHKRDRNSILVKNAFVLIGEIASVLEKKYHKELISKWKELAQDEEIYPVAPKKVSVPRREFPRELDLSFLQVRSIYHKIVILVAKTFALIGFVLGSIVTLGFISTAVCVYQNLKIKLLSNQLCSESDLTKNNIFIKAQYTKTTADSSKILGEPKALSKLYANIATKRFKNPFQEMKELIQAAFKRSFKELLNLSKANQYGIIFNKSSKIMEQKQLYGFWADTYEENKKALYLWMVYRLISQAALKKKQGEFRLYFSHSLFVANSRPHRIPHHNDPHREEIFFLNQDAWTPKNHSLYQGVEPISIKWLLEKIKTNPKDQELLEILLLKSLIPNDSKQLKKNKYYLNTYWNELRHIFLAQELIENLAITLSNNYKDDFYLLWSDLADDKESTPILKTGSELQYLNHIPRSWELPHVIYNKLGDKVKNTKDLIAPIWKDIHTYRINTQVTQIRNLPTKVRDALSYLSSQYYLIHQDVKEVGCLFAALTTHLFQSVGDINKMKPKKISDALADYLADLIEKSQKNLLSKDEKKDFKFFQKEIFQTTQKIKNNISPIGWTVEEYIHWLRTSHSPLQKEERHHFDMGELELELFAKVFNIGIHVFISGSSYRLENGLMMPLRTYGPNTIEKFILFNNLHISFFALMPKLRPSNPLEENSEICSALEKINNFWKSV